MILFLLVALMANGVYTPMDAFASFKECQDGIEEIIKHENRLTKETKLVSIHSYKCIGVPRK